MVKLVHLYCPQCGASLEVEADRKFCFCSYCGAKAVIDDGTTTTRVVDEAKIREAEAMERIRIKEAEAMERIRLQEAEAQVRMRQIKADEKKEKADNFFAVIGIFFILIMLGLMYAFTFYMKTHGFI